MFLSKKKHIKNKEKMRSKSWGFVKVKNTINGVQRSFFRRNLTLQFPWIRGGN